MNYKYYFGLLSRLWERMTKSPFSFLERPKELGRNHQLRRILLYLLVMVMVIFAGMVINGRLFGHGPLAQAQVISNHTSTLVDIDYRLTMGTTPTATQTSTNGSPVNVLSNTTPTVDILSNLDIPSPTSTAEATLAPATVTSDNDGILWAKAIEPGTIYLSMNEGGRKHLFAYHPQSLPFTRLTNGAWDDINPSISPDGNRLAFASNRYGIWDIYILDLTTGKVGKITDTRAYEAAPSWSPDGQWLVYESYMPIENGESNSMVDSSIYSDSNLDIFIQQVSSGEAMAGETVRLTNHPSADFSPTWSPTGRHIAFVSDRSGENEIWLADLDNIDNRFQNFSRNPTAFDENPAWSPDGKYLAWASTSNGFQTIKVMDTTEPKGQEYQIGSGDQPLWDPNGSLLLAILATPNRTYLAGYRVDAPGLALPPLNLPGPTAGMSWGPQNIQQALPDPIKEAAQVTPTPLWQPALTPVTGAPGGRQQIVMIEDVEAPHPMLNDLVDESFIALREELASQIGWDYLLTLENAFVPLTAPLFPGMLNDWLYTGRAFTLNSAPINAGWMVVTREDYGDHTYWRVYLKTRFQDGSQGQPLRVRPWNFNARFNGNPPTYEQGGELTNSIPDGYWVDFTELASSYSWERLPALTTWRSAIQTARYNEFILPDGLDWNGAMREIYPPQAVYTPTPVLPPVHTPTRTPWPTLTPTPTRTPWPTRTPSPTVPRSTSNNVLLLISSS
jgi:TolB protein